MTILPIRSLTATAAVLATGLAIAACGSDNSTGPSDAQVKDAVSAVKPGTATTATTTQATTTAATTTTTQAVSADGKALFTANCAGCHTLKSAGAAGSVGPNLDQLKPSSSTVQGKVEAGGGAMPSFKGQLSPEEIKAIAAYVSSSAGG